MQFYHKLNRWLLERYPLIWTTRLVWVLLAGVLVHAVFFLLGLFTLRDHLILQEYWGDAPYMHNGILLFSIICSILVLVVWMMQLFRHNGFKQFYPSSRAQVFGSFVLYFLIFLFISSFYISYILGYQTYIKSRVSATELQQQVGLANLAAAFLPQHQDQYSIAARKAPAPFDNLYCETEENEIDFSKPYLRRFNDEYQFYKVVQRDIPMAEINTIYAVVDRVIKRQALNDSVMRLWVRGEVVDVSGLADTALSYYNYSQIRFKAASNYRGWAPPPQRDGWPDTAARHLNLQVQQLLNRRDPVAIQSVMDQFLRIAADYQINTNLTTATWFSLIDTARYQVQHFIRTRPREALEDMNDAAGVEVPVLADTLSGLVTPPVLRADEVVNQKNQFFQAHLSDYYFDAASLDTVFTNVSRIRDFSFWDLHAHLLLWLSFVFSVFLFAFRTAGLSSLLLAVITGILLAVFTGLLLLLLDLSGDLPVYYLLLVISTTVLLMPLVGFRMLNKKTLGVLINLSLALIVPWMVLVVFIINQHQEQYYLALYGDSRYYQLRPTLILDLFREKWSYVFLLLGFISIWLYCGWVKKWKALPEG